MNPKAKALEIARFALDRQADRVVILNIKKLSYISDYLLVCGAESERQVRAIVSAIDDGLRKKGVRPLSTEGASEGRWAVMDYNDVVVHVFFSPVRGFYDLEGLWAEAPSTEVKDKAPKKGTGTRSAGKTGGI
ncbi:MAG: ribosome silencing factor [Deltaproteobacteria bacterium]|nr:ribosome silencing factor [Deltaproteobacteria bacterium]